MKLLEGKLMKLYIKKDPQDEWLREDFLDDKKLMTNQFSQVVSLRIGIFRFARVSRCNVTDCGK